MEGLVKAGPAGGGRAAQLLREEVNRYIVTHEEIPIHCKIIARIFFNGKSKVEKKSRPQQRTTSQEFVIKFSEADPLFDFLDCGSGKERADSKIRGEVYHSCICTILMRTTENFNLYVSNPYCFKTFLAICNDNGYVRMLEPYQNLELARSKIVLISNGLVEREYANLPFSLQEFPSVFRPRHGIQKSQSKGRLMQMTSQKLIIPDCPLAQPLVIPPEKGEDSCLREESPPPHNFTPVQITPLLSIVRGQLPRTLSEPFPSALSPSVQLLPGFLHRLQPMSTDISPRCLRGSELAPSDPNHRLPRLSNHPKQQDATAMPNLRKRSYRQGRRHRKALAQALHVDAAPTNHAPAPGSADIATQQVLEALGVD